MGSTPFKEKAICARGEKIWQHTDEAKNCLEARALILNFPPLGARTLDSCRVSCRKQGGYTSTHAALPVPQASRAEISLLSEAWWVAEWPMHNVG